MNAILPYLFWIPITIGYNFLMCWASVHYGDKEFLKMYLFMTAASAIPTWSLAAYFSHNLVFDGLVYDMTLVFSSPLIFRFLGQGSNFPMMAWVGVAITILGLFTVRVSILH